MRKATPGITPEGIPSIGLTSLAAIVFGLVECWPLALLFLLLTAFSLHFFRDPERVVPRGPGLAVSPADGKVIRIEQRADPFSGEQRQCISIFMNVFNVHVNRSPVAGTVRALDYHPGLFLNAALDKASRDNERLAYSLEDADGASWTMVQISGLVARRIVCRVEEGGELERGERFGMIKFGSRVDLYLPEGWSPAVEIGDSAAAGQTMLAEKGDKK